MCFHQGDISTLNDYFFKLVDKVTYLGSRVSSTGSDINMHLAWTAINRLSIIRKSDLSDEIKWNFFQAVVVSILLYESSTWTLTKRIDKRLNGNCTRMLSAILNKSWKQHPRKQHLYGHFLPISKTIQIRRTRHVRTLHEKPGPTHKWRSHVKPFPWTCQYWPTNRNLFTSALRGYRM